MHPDYFRRGIATAMMKEALQIAQELGYTAVFLCGDPQFYHRFGFRGSYEFGIYHVADKSRCGEWCMALELKEELETASGQKRVRILKRLEVVEAFRVKLYFC